MSSFWLFFVHLIHCVLSTVIDNPTSGNLTHQYFINSEYAGIGYFQFDEINCGAAYCHIICDEVSGCYEATVNALVTNTLIIDCLTESACKTITINGPTTNLDIYCGAKEACSSAIIIAETTTNINLACNYTTTQNSFGACYTLELNASQSTFVNIDCIGVSSCALANYNLNNAGTVTVNADSENAMKLTTLYGYNIQNQLHVTCGYYSCHTSNFYCPETNDCNIDCTLSKSCRDAQIYVPTSKYESLNLKCNPIYSDSCDIADIKCSDTTKSTPLIWDSTNSYFKCNTFECCPISEGNITCLSTSNCEVNCTTTNCRNHIINATLASEFTIDCTGSGCDGSTILCPSGDATSCNIYCIGSGATCTYTYIQTGTYNTMDSFRLYCGTSSGCQYMTLSLTPTSIVDVSIDCSSTNACIYSSFNIETVISNDFNLTCSSTGCFQLNFFFFMFFDMCFCFRTLFLK